MSILSNLKLVSSKRNTSISPITQRRNKMIKKLHEQIKLAEALQNGVVYAPTHIKTYINKITGEKQSVEVPKRLREWWHTNETGKLNLILKYGSKQLELTKDKNAIELNSIKELVDTLKALKIAVEQGELDTQIEGVTSFTRSIFRKTNATLDK